MKSRRISRVIPVLRALSLATLAASPLVHAREAGALAHREAGVKEEGHPFAQAKSEMRKAIDSGQAAGAAHMVVKDGQVIYFDVAGARDIEEKLPLRPDTILRIYSMSKPITSVAAMTLFEQGKFELDDPVSMFIPAFANSTVLVKDGDQFHVVPPKRPITVRDVFRHTTGYGYDGGGNAELEKHYQREKLAYRPPYGMFPPALTIEQAAEALARIPAAHHPGERFTYGFNTDLLGRLVEIWSGQPLDRYLRETVLDPLEMFDTSFSVPEEKRGRLASCHAWKEGRLVIADKADRSPYNQGFEFLSGGGGLVSTMRDYANFCQMMVDAGTFKNRPILRPETVQLIFTDQLDGVAGPFRFGLGFAIGEVELGSGEAKRKASQYSWGGYASTDFRLVPEERLFQIFMRQRVPSTHELANKIFQLVYQEIP